MESKRNFRFYLGALVMGMMLALELSACGSGGLSGTVTAPGGVTPILAGGTVSSVTTTSTVTATTYTIGGTISSVANYLPTTILSEVVGTSSVAYTSTSGVITTPINFTFASAVASGATYTVSVASQPVTGTCTVTNATGTATANVTNVAVQCP